MPGWTQGLSEDWPSWRGPRGTGEAVSPLSIGTLSEEQNRLWRVDFASRSTPIVHGGKVHVTGRTRARGLPMEQISVFDAKSGASLWSHRWSLYQSAAPFRRSASASPAVDPGTGNVYVLGGGGLLFGWDRQGKLLWKRHLVQEFGAYIGDSGSTANPVVDRDLVVVSVVGSAWKEGELPRQKYIAMNKSTGEVQWIAQPGQACLSRSAGSTPVVAEIKGQRLLIGANADGAIDALQIRTGKTVWRCRIAESGIQTSVAVAGDRIFAAHGGKNPGRGDRGSIVAIDATGSGDITSGGQIWRIDGVSVSASSPLVHQNRLYIADDTAILRCLDTGSGKEIWRYRLDSPTHGSPVWAGGKILLSETRGRFFMLSPSKGNITLTGEVSFSLAEGRFAQIHGSPAVAYDRIYLATEEGLYCFGDPASDFEMPSSAADPTQPPDEANSQPEAPAPTATHLQVLPALVDVTTGNPAQFRAQAYNRAGAPAVAPEPSWQLQGLEGRIGERGTAVLDAQWGVGEVLAESNGLKGQARVRAFPPLPWRIDFENMALDRSPPAWVCSYFSEHPSANLLVKLVKAQAVLVLLPEPTPTPRIMAFFGPSNARNYVLQADVLGFQRKRFRPDIGILSQGQTLVLAGNRQQLRFGSPLSEGLPGNSVDFPWEPEVWYTMRMRVEHAGGKALIKGKVWPRDEPEPESWTISKESVHPIPEGSPGIYGFPLAEIHFDNLIVKEISP